MDGCWKGLGRLSPLVNDMVGGDVSVYSYALWSTLGIRGLDLCSTHFSGGCHLERASEPGSTCLPWDYISEWV